MPPPVCAASTPRAAPGIRGDRAAAPHWHRHRVLSAVPPGPFGSDRHPVSPGATGAGIRDRSPTIRRWRPGPVVCLGTEVVHVGTLPVCPQADGPPKEARAGGVLGRRRQGRQRPAPLAQGSVTGSRVPPAHRYPLRYFSNPQGAGFLSPAASSNASYVSCGQAPLRASSVNSRTTHKILSKAGKHLPHRVADFRTYATLFVAPRSSIYPDYLRSE